MNNPCHCRSRLEGHIEKVGEKTGKGGPNEGGGATSEEFQPSKQILENYGQVLDVASWTVWEKEHLQERETLPN